MLLYTPKYTNIADLSNDLLLAQDYITPEQEEIVRLRNELKEVKNNHSVDALTQMMEQVLTDTTFLKGRFTTPIKKPAKKRVTETQKVSDIKMRLLQRGKKVAV